MTRTAPIARRSGIAAAALLAGAALLLAGCGSSQDAAESGIAVTKPASDAAVYQFDQAKVEENQEAFVVMDQPMVIQLSDGLRKVVVDQQDFMPVDHYTLTAKSFDTGMCRLDVAVSYAEGGKKVLEDELIPRRDGESPFEAFQTIIIGYDFSNDFRGDYLEVDKLPPDADLAADTTYVSKDREHMTVVRACGAENFFALNFPYSKAMVKKTSDLATVDFSVDQGGQSGAGDSTSVSVVDATVLGNFITVSPAGEWQAV